MSVVQFFGNFPELNPVQLKVAASNIGNNKQFERHSALLLHINRFVNFLSVCVRNFILVFSVVKVKLNEFSFVVRKGGMPTLGLRHSLLQKSGKRLAKVGFIFGKKTRKTGVSSSRDFWAICHPSN